MVVEIPPDPLQSTGIQGFAERLRAGETTAEATVGAYLKRIEALDSRLGAYEYVAGENAVAQAMALDRLLACGTDLGPLMGVPVAVKDLFAVEGMPTTAGSNLDVSDLVGSEGRFVGMLKRAGCIILGKTKTVEFAMGGTGINLVRGTPWNPWDADIHRVPGGSSSGSAVAAAAGLCAFSIGSDTGGSVRIPAYSGIVGLKTTRGLWPTGGVAPLCRTLDTIGLITTSASDAATAFGALAGIAAPVAAEPRGLRLGRPATLFFEGLDRDVERCTEAALTALRAAGSEIVDCALPETAGHMEWVQALIAAEFMGAFGRERFEASCERHSAEPAHLGQDEHRAGTECCRATCRDCVHSLKTRRRCGTAMIRPAQNQQPATAPRLSATSSCPLVSWGMPRVPVRCRDRSRP